MKYNSDTAKKYGQQIFHLGLLMFSHDPHKKIIHKDLTYMTFTFDLETWLRSLYIFSQMVLCGRSSEPDWAREVMLQRSDGLWADT